MLRDGAWVVDQWQLESLLGLVGQGGLVPEPHVPLPFGLTTETTLDEARALMPDAVETGDGEYAAVGQEGVEVAFLRGEMFGITWEAAPLTCTPS